MGLMYVRGETGATLTFDTARLPLGVQHRLDNGDLTRINPDGTVWTGDSDGEPDITDNQPPDAPPLPTVRDNRATWVTFAISQGMDREKAAAMTKAELVEEFTKLRAVS